VEQRDEGPVVDALVALDGDLLLREGGTGVRDDDPAFWLSSNLLEVMSARCTP
jgi:hypothetical protein